MDEQLESRSSTRRYAINSGESASKPTRSSSGRMMLLPDVDEELDYSEDDLPSVTNRAMFDKTTNRERSQLGSPEEGEEEFEDSDDGVEEIDVRRDRTAAAAAAIRSTRTTTAEPHSSYDREEGEASSEEDKRTNRQVKVKSSQQHQHNKRLEDFVLDEAEYRDRLHARHERRERERLRDDYRDSVVVVDPNPTEFAHPRPYFESSTENSQQDRTDRRRSETGRQSEDHHSLRLSHSSTYLLEQQQFDQLMMPKMSHKESSSEHRRHSSSRLSKERGKPNKSSKKSKRRSRHPSVEPVSDSKHSSKIRKVSTSPSASLATAASESSQLEYVDWESYMYAQMGLNAQPEKESSPSHSSSSSRASSNPNANSRSPSTSKHEVDYPIKPHSKRHSKTNHYRREMRETAPPPQDPEARSSADEGDWEMKERRPAHRHRHKTSRYPKDISSSGKRHRRSKEHKSSPSSSIGKKSRYDETVEDVEMLKNNEIGKKEERPPSTSKQQPQQSLLSRSPFKTEPLSEEEDDEPLVEQQPKVEQPANRFEIKPGRYQPSRLYSESESDVDDGQLKTAAADDENGINELLDDQHASSTFLHNDDENIEQITEADRAPHGPPSKPFYFPSIQGCRSVEEFECLNRIEEGTYGVVYRARDKKINEIVALKRLKMEKERDGFPITSLREINTLMKAQHENIVTVREVVVGSNMDKIYLVMDYVEHDMKSLMEIMNGPFSVGEVKCLLVQLLKAVRHLHDNWILHRDLKTSNLLLSHQGILKVGDFGLAREYGSPLKHYTEVVVTLWYRAPELLLGTKKYTCPIDLWSVGCIFAEFLLQRPLFPGKGEVDELNIIFRDLGTPTERIWPGVSQLPGMKKCVFTEYPYNQLRRRFTEKQISDQGFDLLNNFLTYCPEKRINAEKALSHAYFQERPRAIHPSMFPSWPAKSEGGVAVRKNASPRPPVGGGALAAVAQAAAQAAASTGAGGRVRYQPPAPPMGGQRFYSSMSAVGGGGGMDSRPGTAVGSASGDTGFLLRF